MNDDKLRKELYKLTELQPSETARERARHRALMAFQQNRSLRPEAVAQRQFGWSWKYSVALALVFGLVLLPFIRHGHAPENLANDRQILEQTEKLFPNQVNAVVMHNGKTELSISDAATVGSDQPVLLLFRRGHEILRVLSYSGHHVCLKLGQSEECLDILATPDGGVILEGKDQAWLTSEHPRVAGYSVRAHMLATSL